MTSSPAVADSDRLTFVAAALRRCLLIILTALVFGEPVAAKTSARRAVIGVPVLGGRPVERFVLESWIVGGAERGHRPGTVVYNLKVPPNIFAPTIEDDAGVFYQAANPIHSGSVLAQGGIYVMKARPHEIYLFFGNAEGSGRHVTISPNPLAPKDVSKLRIAKVERN